MISIIVPAPNESEAAPIFMERVTPILESAGVPYEIVFVDDGSRDNTASTTCRCNATWTYTPHVYSGIYA
ncbi:MAG: glycosyltransferase [Burkholderiales bacterium]|nr:glycosyltransferase [Anaerolineae bacterium]MCZ2419547.1 glycosyltransferase [Burkholderiales bacterium]